jgi:undecaprenyl-diphosphatase
MLEQLNKWDRELFVFLNSLGIESYDAFWIFVTNFKHWIPLYLLFFIMFFVAFHWKKAILTSFFLVVSFVATMGFTFLVKTMSLRIRPNNQPELKDLIRILQEPTNYSFFSGHASGSFVAATFVVLCIKEKYKWIYVIYIWPILFVMSRIYVGVHFPSDLIVGALVGILFAHIFYRLSLLAGFNEE